MEITKMAGKSTEFDVNLINFFRYVNAIYVCYVIFYACDDVSRF